jgi:hypothetical protein
MRTIGAIVMGIPLSFVLEIQGRVATLLLVDSGNLRLGLKSQHINELQLPHQHSIAEAPSDRLNSFLENCQAPQMPAEKQPLPLLKSISPFRRARVQESAGLPRAAG